MMTKEIVLISGYSGFLAKHISQTLIQAGYEVRGLSQNKQALSDQVFYWNVEEGDLDERALDGVNHIIHLAGAGIADQRWTNERKQLIIDSRVNSTRLLAETLKNRQQSIKTLIGASGIGYYGASAGSTIFQETDAPATDFVGECCRLWENSYLAFNDIADQSVVFRIGTVLGLDGGAIPKMLPVIKAGLGSPLGSGSQWWPWISVHDLSNLMLFAIESSLSGTYNAVVSEHCTNRELMKNLARALNKPFWAPAVPAFVIKWMFGEMSVLFLEGSRVSNEQLIQSGFVFQYPQLQQAFENMLSDK